jgi:hypothetical protein
VNPDHFDSVDRDDDRVLEAALWTAGPSTRDEIAAALGWSWPRLHAAESALEQRLVAGISRLSRSGTRLSIVVDTAILPTDVRHELSAARMARLPLTPAEARRLLELVREEVVHGRLGDPRLVPGTSRRTDTTDDDGLLARGAVEYVVLDGLPAASELRPHPDLMFALGLIENLLDSQSRTKGEGG